MAIITWVGGHIGDPVSWNEPLNWSGTTPAVIPVDDDDVVINSGTNQPLVDVTTASLQSLTVNSGAKLTVGNFIFIAKSTTNKGTITGVFSGANPANNGVTFQFSTAANTLTNSGTITGETGGDGVRMRTAGAVTNSASGTITGGLAGILSISNVSGTVTNAGRITGTTGDGLLLNAGGVITNSTTGVINGGTDGIRSAGASATVTNAGTIQGTGTGAIGVVFSDQFGVVSDNTLTNSGTIIGNAAAAVQFAAGNDTLMLLPGAKFSGLVDGGLGTNTIELTAGSGAGTVAGLGDATKFANFGTLLIDGDAHWTLGGDAVNGLGAIGVAGFTANDTIDLTGFAFASVTGIFASNVLALNDGTSAVRLNIQGNFSFSDFGFSNDGSGGTDIVLAPPPGSVRLSNSHDQYVIVDDNGSMKVTGSDGDKVNSSDDTVLFSDGTGVLDPTGTAEDVARLYYAALGRAPDIDGLKAWTSGIDNSHVPLSAVANSFATSPEFIQTYGSLSSVNFVALLYRNALGRDEDPAGAQAWTGALDSGMSRGTVTLAFAESQENKARTVGTIGDNDNAEVYRLYKAAFNRVPDQAGQDGWASALASGTTLTQIAQGFVNSAEFQHTYGGFDAPSFVSALYQNALGRHSDLAGLQAWTSAMGQGMSQAQVLVGFSDSLENRSQTAVATHDHWVFIHA